MVYHKIFMSYLILPFCFINGNVTTIIRNGLEEKKIDFIVEIIKQHYKLNSWSLFLIVGHFPDEFYAKLEDINYNVNVDIHKEDLYIPDVPPYYSNTIIIKCSDFEEFEKALTKARSYPYWHPPSNIIVYYLRKIDRIEIAQTFFILWYFKSSNVIVVRFDDERNTFLVSDFTSYTYDNYKLESVFGCWTVRKVDIPITNLTKRFACEDHCNNVAVHSKRRFTNMGTCLSFDTQEIRVDDLGKLKEVYFFKDKSRDLHGYPLRGYITEVPPFSIVNENSDGTYVLDRRDGHMWNLFAKLFNFTIDLTPNKGLMKETFNFGKTIQQLTDVSCGKVDLFLMPVYIMDMMVINLDMTFPFKSSGVCFVSHRADFETVLFDLNLLVENYKSLLRFVLCFLFLWLGFFLFSAMEKGRFSFDQAGKDFMNTLRNVLSISLHNPPRNGTIRILLFFSLWGYFIINFATQAVITSFFTTYKRGKEVNTFEDVIEKGYRIFGIASPDIILPDTEEKFRIINSRLIPAADMYECVVSLAHDRHRICLVECSVAKYMERNTLNEKGNQYLHVATEKVHSRYLNMLLGKYSPMLRRFNKYMRILVEAGIIQKWEEYRYNDIKEEVPFRALRVQDIIGVFELYGFVICLSFFVFLSEISISLFYWLKNKCSAYYKKQNAARVMNRAQKLERKLGKIKLSNDATQIQIQP